MSECLDVLVVRKPGAEEFARPGFGVVDISESVGSPCVGEVKALIGFAYPHDEARRGSAAELLNLSDAVDDVVEFWRDLARVGVVCGVVVIFAVLLTVGM